MFGLFGKKQGLRIRKNLRNVRLHRASVESTNTVSLEFIPKRDGDLEGDFLFARVFRDPMGRIVHSEEVKERPRSRWL